eukprot:5507745-Pleurochrysis_carterae.AAC.1
MHFGHTVSDSMCISALVLIIDHRQQWERETDGIMDSQAWASKPMHTIGTAESEVNLNQTAPCQRVPKSS